MTDHDQKDEMQETELERIKKERDEYLDGWKRAKADYDNLIKETERKRTEYTDWANERILTELLPAIDQYETAMQFTPSFEGCAEDQRKRFQNWMVGLEAVRSLWWNAVNDLGLEKIPVQGAFDPVMHDAVGEEEAESVPPGHIIRSTTNGYRLKGKVIRPAKVILNRKNIQSTNS